MIERHWLMGRGIGYVDAHLLASTLLTPEGWLDGTATGVSPSIAHELGVDASSGH